jgi:hypothetical protein
MSDQVTLHPIDYIEFIGCAAVGSQSVAFVLLEILDDREIHDHGVTKLGVASDIAKPRRTGERLRQDAEADEHQ